MSGKNYRLTGIVSGCAIVEDPAQYITRGIVSRIGKTWTAWVPCEPYEKNGHRFVFRVVAECIPTRGEAASYVIWYDSHRNCCEWHDNEGRDSFIYRVAK